MRNGRVRFAEIRSLSDDNYFEVCDSGGCCRIKKKSPSGMVLVDIDCCTVEDGIRMATGYEARNGYHPIGNADFKVTRIKRA